MAQDLRNALREFALRKMRELEAERKSSSPNPDENKTSSTKIKINRDSSRLSAGGEKRSDELQAQCKTAESGSAKESTSAQQNYIPDTSESLHELNAVEENVSIKRHAKDTAEITLKEPKLTGEKSTGYALTAKGMSQATKSKDDPPSSKPSKSVQEERLPANVASLDKSVPSEKKTIQIRITSKLPEPETQPEVKSDSESSSENESDESEDESQVADGLPWRTILEDGELTPDSDSEGESQDEKSVEKDEGIQEGAGGDDNMAKDHTDKDEADKEKKSTKHRHKSKHKKHKHKKSKKKKKKSKHKTDREKEKDSKKKESRKERRSRSSSRKDSSESINRTVTSERRASKSIEDDCLDKNRIKEEKTEQDKKSRRSDDGNQDRDSGRKEYERGKSLGSNVKSEDSKEQTFSSARSADKREESHRNEKGRDRAMKDKSESIDKDKSPHEKQLTQTKLVAESQKDKAIVSSFAKKERKKSPESNPKIKLEGRGSKSEKSDEKRVKEERRERKTDSRRSVEDSSRKLAKVKIEHLEEDPPSVEIDSEELGVERKVLPASECEGQHVHDQAHKEKISKTATCLSVPDESESLKDIEAQQKTAGSSSEAPDTAKEPPTADGKKSVDRQSSSLEKTSTNVCTSHSSEHTGNIQDTSSSDTTRNTSDNKQVLISGALETASNLDSKEEKVLEHGSCVKNSFGTSKEAETDRKKLEKSISVSRVMAEKERNGEDSHKGMNTVGKGEQMMETADGSQKSIKIEKGSINTILTLKHEEKEEGEAPSTDTESGKDVQHGKQTDAKKEKENTKAVPADKDSKKKSDDNKAKGDKKETKEGKGIMGSEKDNKKDSADSKTTSLRKEDGKEKPEKHDRKEKDRTRKKSSDGKKEKDKKGVEKEEGAIDSEIEEGEIIKKHHKKSKKKDHKKRERSRDRSDERDRDRKEKRRRSESRSHSRSHSHSHKRHKRSRSKSRSDDYDSEGSQGKKTLIEKSYFSESRGCWVTHKVPKEDSDISSSSGDERKRSSDRSELYDIRDTYIRHPPRERRTVFERLGGDRFTRRDDRRDFYERPYGFRRRRRSYSRSRSRSRSPKLDIDKKKLLEIAKANALMQMRSGELPATVPVPETLKKAAIAYGTNETIQRLTDQCKAIANADGGSSDDESPVNRPVGSDDDEEEDEEGEMSRPFVRHPFRVKEAPPIVMNIKDAVQIPVVSKDKLRVQFPVSSGSQHRKKEDETVSGNPNDPYGQWTAVEKPKPIPAPKEDAAPAATQAAAATTTAATPATPATPAVSSTTTTATTTTDTGAGSSYIPGVSNVQPPKPVAEEDKVFEDAPSFSYDIGEIVSARLKAARQLQSNPHNVEALTVLHHSQQQIQTWAHSSKKPGLFTGSTDATFLRPEELAHPNRKFQAWIKKDMFLTAAPVSTDIGRTLMEKMGWQQGEGLGKNKEGSLNPLLLEIKTDRQGLVAAAEKPKKKGDVSKVIRKDLSGKHPVMALNELCNKRHWGKPNFECVREDGPSHKKNFVFKVRIRNEEYMPTVASGNKKDAKAMAATVALQKMGLIPT